MPFEEFVAAHARVSSKAHSGVSIDDKMSFFQMLSTLVCSGTPLLQALRQAGQQSQSKKLRAVLDDIAGRVAAGSSFHGAAASYTRVFEPYWIEVIRTGELSGQMGTVLLELNKQIRESRETRRKITGSLMYPIILIFVAVIAVTVMLWMVVPTFAKMFKDMGAQLPAITQFVVDASDGLVKYGPYAVAGFVAVAVAFRRYSRTEGGKRTIGGLGLITPMIGSLMVQMAMYRFASNIALLLKSGVPMLETLTTISGVYQNNPIYREAMLRAPGPGRRRPAARRGPGRDRPVRLDAPQHGPHRRGVGPARLRDGAGRPLLQREDGRAVTKVTKMLEPIIIMGMGSTIAGLMLAIYMPMFEMAGKVN